MSKVVIDVSVRSKNVYFDTNIYDRVLDDPEKQQIIERIKEKKFIVMPSVVNLCELLMISAPYRKTELMRVFHEIKDDFHTLKPYTWLLEESINNIQSGLDELEVNYPIPINDQTENVCRELMDKKKGELVYIQNARSFIQGIKKREPFPTELKYFELIDSENGQKKLIEIVDQFCVSKKMECRLDEEKMKTLVTSPSMPWKYYLESYFYPVYRRIYLDTGCGVHSNPGSADQEQCTYLFWASKFITEDGDFLEFLKNLKKIRGYEAEIMNYSDFKKALFS